MQKFLLGITTVIISITYCNAAQAILPQNFQLIEEDTGVQVYKKDYPDRKPDYVTVVNLKKATLRNLTGTVTGTNYGTVKKKLLWEFWQDAVKKNSSKFQAKIVVNGAFFSTNDDPTGIAFGLKLDGNLISYGYAIGKEYPGLICTFAFNPFLGIANIQSYSKKTFNLMPEVVGGLDANADKSADKYLPRTFVGVRDDDGNFTKETVILYSSSYARQIDAVNTLSSFGATATAMLDGGGSTGLIVDGKSLISTKRKVPHALAVYAGM